MKLKTIQAVAAALGMFLFAGFPMVHAQSNAPTNTNSNAPQISGETLRYVLHESQLMWTAYNFTFGELRSAYNSGALVIVLTVKSDGDYYDVYYGGLTLCVIDSGD